MYITPHLVFISCANLQINVKPKNEDLQENFQKIQPTKKWHDNKTNRRSLLARATHKGYHLRGAFTRL